MLQKAMSVETGSDWSRAAIRLLEADSRRSGETHLVPLSIPSFSGVDFYLKDESSHPTGSLKHRLARSLILYGICNGLIGPTTTLVEASSGSTAVSEAYFARLIGLKFIAVLPRSTSRSKIQLIEQHGGHCHYVDDPSRIYDEARELAQVESGHYLDQFTFAERAADWRGNNNIAESIFSQMSLEQHSEPDWIVMSAGTGGTSATIGRYILYRGLRTQLCVPDAENSAFFEGWCGDSVETKCQRPSRIEGIGRPRVEPSFVPNVVSAMLKVPDTASIAATRILSELLGRRVGASTGTNFIGLLWAADGLVQSGKAGSIASLICDSGERYRETYFDDAWLAEQNLYITGHEAMLRAVLASGRFDPALLIDGNHRTCS
ncbi:MAG: PLP-dependent cysteine synthase family protein [Candidatus Devosia phytovorans]|uniref:L-cysteine desulfhydrase Cds1 n=1 Tax=Candidatus Devosia phytovorans TaxID=3121372 RepID=A0AAJ5VZP5_9HYPH|nr:PLP-dependent cysteine synthase family protein [Devosia sp.]WEK06439.1 MAG: PLP-dependent cysteine synthase family protein [Devosia sp.]